jgi:hypothetical protein
VATTTCVRYCSKTDSEAYEDALDAIRLYAAKHPEWRTVLKSIQSYVGALEASAGLHEPGL